MNKLLILIIAVIVIAGAAIYMMQGGLPEVANMPAAENEPSGQANLPIGGLPQEGGGTTASPETPQGVIIRYTDAGYAPRTVTIKAGTKVTFLNESSMPMWPASAMHPTHLLLPELDAKAGVQAAGSYSFVFERAGGWKFHDHLKPMHTGEIVVE